MLSELWQLTLSTPRLEGSEAPQMKRRASHWSSDGHMPELASGLYLKVIADFLLAVLIGDYRKMFSFAGPPNFCWASKKSQGLPAAQILCGGRGSAQGLHRRP